jgi:type I restriction enzyme M protein
MKSKKSQLLKNSKICSDRFINGCFLIKRRGSKKMEIAELKEGWILDFCSKKPVDGRKPEEIVRQQYEKTLFEDFNYDCDMMDIEVPIQRGEQNNKKNKNERADIVIYKTNNKQRRTQNEDILAIVETKRPTRKEGVKQLMSYMTASSALFGVWTNGEEIEYLYKNTESGEIKRDYIFQIPKKGETIETIGHIAKSKLKPVKNLKPIFKRILKTLYSNTNISRKEKLGSEMIRLIFCKIMDEKYNQNAIPEFRILPDERPESAKKRIDSLFSEVKEELSEDGVFDKSEKITLDAKSVSYVIGELQSFSLLKSEKDVIGEAFETFAESKLVGDKGEFFTPREVVKTAIKIINPQPRETIFDPACGSGGFLIYALEHIWNIMENDKRYKDSNNLESLKKEIAERYFYGIDKEIDLVKIAKAYMSIIGDGRSKIAQENTLHTFEDYQPKPKELFVGEDGKPKQFDCVLTNPPFGTKIKVLKEDSKQFNLGHVWKKEGEEWIKTAKEKDTEPQVLFIERCLQFLKNGGKLGIILPETYFHSPSTKYVLDYIKRNNNIIALVDLPHNTFRPYCNAKTCLLVLQKGRPQQSKIIMAVAEEMGHDHRGKTIFRYDESNHKFTEELWDDMEVIREELDSVNSSKNNYVFTVKVEDIVNNLYVPRYYWQKKIEGLEEDAKKQNLKFVRVQELIDKGIIKVYKGHGAPPSEFKGKGDVPYVRADDIVGWELYKSPNTMIPLEVYQKVKGKKFDLKPRDIVFVKEGSYRIGSVAMVSPFDTKILLNHHSIVFRVIDEENEYNIDSYYLIYLFSHNLTQKQLYNKVMIDTTLPNIGSRWAELYLPISKDKKVIDEISSRVKKLFDEKWDSVKELGKLKEDFGDLVT